MVALKRQAALVTSCSDAGELPLITLDLIELGGGRLLSEEVPRGAMPGAGAALAEPGDVLFGKLRPYLAKSLLVSRPSYVSTELLAIRPSHRLEPRFLAYVVQSRPFIEWTVATSEGTKMPRTSWEKASSYDMPEVETGGQRAIADFLDTETARIDAVIAKKRNLIGLLNEWEQAQGLMALGDFRLQRTQTLRQYGATVLTGPFGTVLSASEYVEGGIPLINPTHITRGRIEPESSVSVPAEVAERIARHRLSTGDVVMGRKGDVGRCAIVSPSADGWICGSDSIAIHTDGTRLLPSYLASLLQLDLYRQQLQRSSSGAMVSSVNEPTLLALKVPALSPDCQAKAVEQWAAATRSRDALMTRLERQIDLLQEHRQALITAAVTGELEMPGVAA